MRGAQSRLYDLTYALKGILKRRQPKGVLVSRETGTSGLARLGHGRMQFDVIGGCEVANLGSAVISIKFIQPEDLTVQYSAQNNSGTPPIREALLCCT